MIPFAGPLAADVLKLPKLVQSTTGTNSGGTSGSTFALSYASATLGGSLLVCITTNDFTGSVTVSSITDTQGNTWKKAITVTQGTDNQHLEIWYCEGSFGGGNTVTANFSGSCTGRNVTLAEVSGIARTNSLDQTSAASGSSAAANSGSVTPGNFNEYCVGGMYSVNTLTAGAGWTKEQSSDVACQLMDYQASNDQSVAANATLTSGTWAAMIATFRAAGQGAD